MKLTSQFFRRAPQNAAHDLIGRELVRDGSDTYRAQIIETGAYRGRGGRTAGSGIAYEAGRIYIMPYRGRHFLNIATEGEGVDSCVQIRKVRMNGEVLGPMQLTQQLQINATLDNEDIEGQQLWIEGERADPRSIRYVSPNQEDMAPNCLGYWRLVSP